MGASLAVDQASIRIVVEKVRVEGRGCILLTGPSSCGKGEIAKSLRGFLSLPPERHVSMGAVLRETIQKAEADDGFRKRLAAEHGIHSDVSVLDNDANPSEIVEKASRYADEMSAYFGNEGQPSQFDWLCFCVNRGLLIPDDWAERIIRTHLEGIDGVRDRIFLLDGHPRTSSGAERLLKDFDEMGIGIIKVLHLSITKDQMMVRAAGRGREDDTKEALESRYDFYVEKVQPSVDYLKERLGPGRVSLIDAHQPVFDTDRKLDVARSIRAVTVSVMEALGLPNYMLDLS